MLQLICLFQLSALFIKRLTKLYNKNPLIRAGFSVSFRWQEDALAASQLRYDEGSRVDIGLHEPEAEAGLEGHLLAAVHLDKDGVFVVFLVFVGVG